MSNKHVVLVGAGVMSSTLAMLIKRLEPGWDITILEREDAAAEESYIVWNNAGTGHEARCELNHTPEREDETIHTDKALEIYNQFQVSKQFWSDLITNGYMSTPEDFIRPLPHVSFVQGQKNIDFLSKRYNKISKLPAFENMEYTEDAKTIKRWSPL